MPADKKPFQPILTPEQVQEIRAHYKMADKMQKARGLTSAPQGMADRLAIKYGVSRRTIEHLRTGDRWRSLLGTKKKRRRKRNRPPRAGDPLPGE